MDEPGPPASPGGRRPWFSLAKDGTWRRWNPQINDWEPSSAPSPEEIMGSDPEPLVRDPWKAADEGTGFKDYLKSGHWLRSLGARPAARPPEALTVENLTKNLRATGPALTLRLLSAFVLMIAFGLFTAWWLAGYTGEGSGGLLFSFGPWRNIRWLMFAWLAALLAYVRLRIAVRDRIRRHRAEQVAAFTAQQTKRPPAGDLTGG